MSQSLKALGYAVIVGGKGYAKVTWEAKGFARDDCDLGFVQEETCKL